MVESIWLSGEQRDIRDVARKFLEQQYPIAWIREYVETAVDKRQDPGWQRIVELGWPAVGLDETKGGVGYGAAERCLLLEEMGKVLLPAPYLSSAVLARDVLEATQLNDAGEQLLGEVAAGTKRATLVVGGELHRSGASPADMTVDASGALSGDSGVIVDASTADVAVVVARMPDDQLGLFALDLSSDGVSRSATELVDATRPYGSIVATAAVVQRLDAETDVTDAVQRGLTSAAVGLAAEMAGAAQHCLDVTLDYVKQREQFGVPIGSFQAIKHRLADLAVDVDAAQESVYFAAQLLDTGQPDRARLAAAAAKAAASDAFELAGAEMVQLHGGIGVTWEHEAHLFYKRAKVSALFLGSAEQHRASLGSQLVAAAR